MPITSTDYGNGYGSLTITDRQTIAWYWKIQPWWWLYNSDEPEPPAWYKPENGKTKRTILWYIRNPFHNLTNTVIGVSDRNYTAYGRFPLVNQRSDINQTGWQYSVIKLNFLVYLPWLSYCGTRVIWYMGWQPEGKFALKFNILGRGPSAV